MRTSLGKLIGYESVEAELETLLLNTADPDSLPSSSHHLKQSVNLAKKVNSGTEDVLGIAGYNNVSVFQTL